jgi:two-component system sensor kinase FixL
MMPIKTQEGHGQKIIQAQQILDSVGDGVYSLDLQGNITYVNSAAAKMTGWRAEELIGQNAHTLHHKSTSGGSPHLLKECPFYADISEGEIRRETDEVFRKQDGSTFPVEYVITPIMEQGSKFHQQLREIVEGTAPVTGEHYFSSLVKHLAESLQYRYAMIGKIVPGPENRIQTEAFFANGKIVKNVIYSIEGTPCEKVTEGRLCLYPEGVQKCFPDDKPLVDLEAEGYLGVPLLNQKTGQPMGLLTVMHDEPILDTTSILAILKIFAGRAEAEFQRQRVERDLKQILDSAGEGIYGVDLSGNATFVNPAGARMVGYEVEELIGKNAHAIQHHSKPDGSPYPEAECPIYAAFKDGKVHHETDEVFWKKDGTSFPVEYVSTPIFEDGIIQGAVVAFPNIAERKENEIKLLVSEERLVSILKNSPTVIYLKDIQGRYMLINNQYETLFNLTNDEIKGKTDLEVFPKEIAETFMANDQRVIARGVPLEFEEVAPDADGLHSYISTKFPLRDSRGEIYGLCGISLDVTERKQAEERLKNSQEQLLHIEKLRAIGKLSASIAHEFNNPIYGIRNVLEKISDEVDLSDKQASFVRLAIDECNRIKNLTMKLQDFNRPSSDQFEMLDIHGVIDDMLILMKKKFKEKGIQLTKNYAVNIPEFPGISDQIKQVTLNLLQNAEEAVSTDGGTITVTTRVRSSQLQIEVEDNGSGILPENKDKIFEPFFTTKSSVKGIGLGLSVTHGIVEAHGGKIKVHSFPGKGTSFTVELPCKRATATKIT